MFRSTIFAIAIGIVTSFSIGPLGSSTALAMDPKLAPKPCAKYKRGTKLWKECRKRNGLSTTSLKQTEQALTLGYALAKTGQYRKALEFLRPEEATNDPRILTYIGFSERKLGRIDVALKYYARAIAFDPHNVSTLSYMGEAHLQKGDVASAEKLLERIAFLCDSPCEAHAVLNKAIGDHISKG